jgi:intraflagellar transport protein 172
MIIHLATQREACRHKSQPVIAAKLATALLRYVGEIPADKAYYDAGIACKEAGWTNMALAFLNKYLDVSFDDSFYLV